MCSAREALSMTTITAILRRNVRPTRRRRAASVDRSEERSVHPAPPGRLAPMGPGVAMIGDMSGLMLNEPAFGLGL
jgi:hypothetical protein